MNEEIKDIVVEETAEETAHTIVNKYAVAIERPEKKRLSAVEKAKITLANAEAVDGLKKIFADSILGVLSLEVEEVNETDNALLKRYVSLVSARIEKAFKI